MSDEGIATPPRVNTLTPYFTPGGPNLSTISRRKTESPAMPSRLGHDTTPDTPSPQNQISTPVTEETRTVREIVRNRETELEREAQIVKALRIAVQKKQAEISSGQTDLKKTMTNTQQHLHAVNIDLAQDAFLQKLDARRQFLYARVGRQWKGTTRSSMNINQLHAGDLDTQKQFEDMVL